MFTFAILCHSKSVCRLSSVCLSVTFVRPTQMIEIFGNVSTPLGTLVTLDIQVKFTEIVPGEPLRRGSKHKRGSRIQRFWTYRTLWNGARYEAGAKLVLITNRKSHMTFRLVPNSVTLDDLERRNSLNGRVFSPNSVGFGADYVKVIEDTQILSAAEMQAKESSFQRYIIYGDISRRSPPRER